MYTTKGLFSNNSEQFLTNRSTGLVSGQKKAMVPWLSITKNLGLYFADQYFPATTPFKEPTKLTYAQVTDILHFWRCRQQDTLHDIFKFQKWKDFDGILCDPVTEEPMANKSGKGKPGRSVASRSAKTLGKRPAREIPGKTLMWWSTYHWHPLKRLVMMRIPAQMVTNAVLGQMSSAAAAADTRLHGEVIWK